MKGGGDMKKIGIILLLFQLAMVTAVQSQPAVLPANIDVSVIGAATYTVPIEVVPGTAGIQPNLSIVYNSMSGFGAMGQKWSLQGISAISRTPQSKYYDHNVSPVSFDTSDRFSLDGNRMLLFSGSSYQCSNAVYCFETEDFSRITKVDASGVFYFKKMLDDGTVIEYGSTSQSKLVLANGQCLSWMVSKVSDPAGNYMTYNYQQANGEIWIDYIDYTFLADGTPSYARVDFAYDSLTNPNDSYISGQKVRQSLRLRGVTVSYRNTMVRRYQFDYNANLQYDRLSAVKLYDSDNELLSTTTVSWNTPSNSIVTDVNMTTLLSGYYVVAGNFDRDRIYDVVAVNKSSRQMYIMKGTPNGPGEKINLNYQLPSLSPETKIEEMLESMMAVDIDNDGVDELLYCRTTDYLWFVVKINSNLSITVTELITSGYGLALADFDADGAIEPAVIMPFGIFSCNFEGEENHTTSIPHRGNSYCVGDFDGDGKGDLLLIDSAIAHIYTYNIRSKAWVCNDSLLFTYKYQYCMTGDFNGDGLSDVIYLPANESQWRLAIRKGVNSWSINNVVGLNGEHRTVDTLLPRYPLVLCDINGDGKTDILQSWENTSVRYIISGGCSNGNYQIYSSGDFSRLSNQVFQHNYYTLGDFDGNGVTDLLFSIPNTGGQFGSIKYFYKNSLPGHYVDGISDAAGKEIKIEYSNISLMPYRYFGAGMNWMTFPLVKNLLVSNGVGGYDTTSYYYGGARIDGEKHQFIGFSLFAAKNGKKISEIFMSPVTNSDFNSYGLLMPDSVVSFISHSPVSGSGAMYQTGISHIVNPQDSLLVSKSFSSNIAVSRTNPLGTTSILPYAMISEQYDYLKNSKTTTITNLNNSLWRVSQQNTETGYITGSTSIANRQFVNYTYTNVSLTNGATIVKPLSIITRHYPTAIYEWPRYDTVMYGYNGKGKVSYKKHGDNCGFFARTDYQYNSMGMPTRVTIVPRRTTGKYNFLYYDSTSRFVVRKVDQANNNTYKSFDPTMGLCLTETDINGFVTSHEYDSWGRLTKTTYPDSTSRTVTYTVGTGGLANTQCYKTIVESGKPETRLYYDLLGRNTHTYAAAQGYMDVVYDELGQVEKQTIVPYNPASLPASSKRWRSFKYDSFGRLTQDSSRYQKQDYTYGMENGDYRYFESVENKMGAVTTKYYDAAGRVLEVEDDGGSITYVYDRAFFADKTCDRMRITMEGNTTTIITDSRGNRLQIIDPNAGTVTNTYNLWNNLLTQTDGKGDVTTMTYDNQGRMITKKYTLDGNDDRFTYGYGSTSPSRGHLTSVYRNNFLYQQFLYDSLGRLSSTTRYIDTLTFSHQYTYNNKGQLYTIQYPSGYVVRHEYDTYGRLSQLQNHANNALIYTIESRNTLNQPTLCWYGNNTGVEIARDAWGLPTQIKYGYRMIDWPNFPNSGTGLPQDEIMGGNRPPDIGDPLDPIILPHSYVGNQYSILQYTYNDNGYITRRKDAKNGQQEDYTYDILGRLSSYTVNDTMTRSFTYASNGNITRNGNLGSYDYVYGSTRPNAVTQVYDERGMIPTSRCDVTYNSRNRAATISECNRLLELSYGEGLQCEKTVFSVGGNMVKTALYPSKDCEYEKTPTYSRYIDYIFADGKMVALHVHNTTVNADSMYYVQTDMLGSWERVVNASKGVVQSSHFDPWGNRMTVANWAAHHPDSVFQFRRGFTGHEHYDRFGIINMNARLYDPAIGRFFSPDPQVQNPFSTQGYNRYSYCGNNPVMCTDPDGEFVWWIPLIGAAVGGTINLATKATQGKIKSFKDGLVAFGIGAAAGAAATIVGTASLAAIGGAGAYGFVGGVATGVTSSFVSSATISAGNNTYFGDPMPTTGQFLSSMALGGLIGGVSNGITSYANGNSFFYGNPRTGTVSASELTSTYSIEGKTPNQIGREGEEAANIQAPKERIESLTGTAKYRIPDGLDHEMKILYEVKNVSYQGYTYQIKDFIMYCKMNNYTFILYVRDANTTFSQSLADALKTVTHETPRLW